MKRIFLAMVIALSGTTTFGSSNLKTLTCWGTLIGTTTDHVSVSLNQQIDTSKAQVFQLGETKDYILYTRNVLGTLTIDLSKKITNMVTTPSTQGNISGAAAGEKADYVDFWFGNQNLYPSGNVTCTLK